MILLAPNSLAFRLAKSACDHGLMTYEPDTDETQLFARHKRARQTIKETRKPVMEAAERAIRAGATNQRLAELTGLTAETFRTLAEKIGVDNRAKAPTVGREAQARRASASDSPIANPNRVHAAETPRLPSRIADLSDKQALELCERAYAFADDRQASTLDSLSEEDGPVHARAVIAAAIEFNPPLLLESDLRTV